NGWDDVPKPVNGSLHFHFELAGKSINELGRLSCPLLVKGYCRCGFLRDGRNDNVGEWPE
ncbi:MAG TPA: hypothetical protein VJ991_01975, partial [Balneolales bacterium]|nr:hypothetical protein [Balneolales bacterium]